MGYIYSVKNKLTGWEYIGMTTKTPEIRYEQHIKDSEKGGKLFFHWALRTYGVDNFELTRLYNGISCTTEKLLEIEIWYIALHNTYHGDGYNSHIGGEIEFKHGPLNLYRPCYDTANNCNIKKVTKREYKKCTGRYLCIFKQGYYTHKGERYRSSADLPFKLSPGALHRRCVTDNMYYLTRNAFSVNKDPYTQVEIDDYISNKKRWCDLGWGFDPIGNWGEY